RPAAHRPRSRRRSASGAARACRSSRCTSGNPALEAVERRAPAIEIGARAFDRELDVAQLVFCHHHRRERVLASGESGERCVDALARGGELLLLVELEYLRRFLDLVTDARAALLQRVGDRCELRRRLGLFGPRALQLRIALAALPWDRDAH